ncbi:hypothetical protein [Serratia sp. UGAL515B_01]|uniref:hypothetical protein n=1 Tax=Serratia sp. UGAL515B_01 TaxID=2986763 RepID=UPI0029541DDF|nr:hypothetical protein [Serratia sp. UGAL515B_01]WON77558.1 hypothetical protein OK023_02295 [Serratia sp. UGAL515B_01]
MTRKSSTIWELSKSYRAELRARAGRYAISYRIEEDRNTGMNYFFELRSEQNASQKRVRKMVRMGCFGNPRITNVVRNGRIVEVRVNDTPPTTEK